MFAGIKKVHEKIDEPFNIRQTMNENSAFIILERYFFSESRQLIV